jgi:hypothetical protein
MTVIVVFDATALAHYGGVDGRGLTVGEIIAEVADDASATIAIPVLAVAEAVCLLGANDDDLVRLSHMLDPDEFPIAHIPVRGDDGESLGRFCVLVGDLPSAHAALVSVENQSAPILTADGDRYRAAKLGLDILDL